MAQEIIALIAQFGVLVVFLNVLVTQLGAPLPAVPTLVVAGALAATGQLPVAGVVLAAVSASLLSDLAWYGAGRRFGSGVIRTVCRISLSPDSCVKQSEVRFQRWRGRVLLIAKFVPGLSTVAPPLVGAMGLRMSTFVLLDGIGSLLWSGIAVGLGYVFAAQIDGVLTALARAGTVALEALLVLLALYIAVKWWQRRRLLVALRMARITVDELNRAMVAGDSPIVVDVRSQPARLLDTRTIPGAVLVDLGKVGDALHDIKQDRALVIYCNCPNEVSAASAARQLMAVGYRNVRPLLGGLDAWDAAGYPLEHWAPVTPVADDPLHITA